MLCVAQGMCVELRNTSNDEGLEAIGVFRNGTGDLHYALTFQRGSRWMFREEQSIVPGVTLYQVIPALAKIVFDISGCRSFNVGVNIVPGIGLGILRVAA